MLSHLNSTLDSPPTSVSILLNLALTSEVSLVLVFHVAFSVELLVLEVSCLVVDAWVPAVVLVSLISLTLKAAAYILMGGLFYHPQYVHP